MLSLFKRLSPYVSMGDQGLSWVANMASARVSAPRVRSSTRSARAKGVKTPNMGNPGLTHVRRAKPIGM